MAWKYILPENMFDVLEHLSDEEAWQIIKKIWSFLLDKEDVKISDKLEWVFLAYISLLKEDKIKRNAYYESKVNNPTWHWRPKKNWDNKQKAKKAKKAKKATDSIVSIVNINYIINKEDILEILNSEEIEKNKWALNVLMKMIKMWYKLEKKKECLEEYFEWIRDLIKQTLPLKQNWFLDWEWALVLIKWWVDYWEHPPKGKTYPSNFRSSVRSSFTLLTKQKW